MYTLKTITQEALPNALAKAERYRLLGDPLEAESICLDILEVDSSNREALTTLFLSYTDEFKNELYPAFTKAEEVLGRFEDKYCKLYYTGILYERRAKFHLNQRAHGSGHQAYQWFQKALTAFDNALSSCSNESQDAALRWNACARIIMRNSNVVPAPDDTGEQMLE